MNRSSAFALCLCLVLASCGKPAAPATYAATEAALDELGRGLVADLNDGVPLATALEQAAARLRTNPVVKSANATNSGLHARFVNDVRFVLPIAAGTPPASSSDGLSTSRSPLATELVRPGRVIFLDSEQVHSDYALWEATWQNQGYEVTRVTPVTVEAFRGLDAFGVVVAAVHGAVLDLDATDAFMMLTDERRTEARDADFEQALDFFHDRVTLGRTLWLDEPAGAAVDSKTRYGVTDRYLDAYTGQFEPESLALIDSCSSSVVPGGANGPPLAMTLAKHGLRGYLGWTSVVSESHTVLVTNALFRLMLGRTVAAARFDQGPTPPVRPFNVVESMSALKRQQLDVDRRSFYGLPPARLNYEFLGTSSSFSPGFAPSVDAVRFVVDRGAGTQRLEVSGDFGGREAVLRLCDTLDGRYCRALNTVEADERDIEADFGSHCTQHCTGYVVVEVEEHRSNGYPLTEWRPTLTVTGDHSSTGPHVELALAPVVRAGITPMRLVPDGNPVGITLLASGPAALESSATLTFSGTFETTTWRYVWSGEQRLAPPTLVLNAIVSPLTRLMTLSGQVTATAHGTRTHKTTGEVEAVEATVEVPAGYVFDMALDGALAAGHWTSGRYSSDWPAYQPASPPRDDVPR